MPVFSAGGEVFFRRVEGSSGFLYRVREDGTGLRRAADSPILGLGAISPDRRWLTMWPPSGAEGAESPVGSALMLRIDGSALLPVRVPRPSTDGVSQTSASVQWPADGKHIFVERGNKTYVVSLPPGQLLPKTATGDFPSDQEMAKLPGVRVIPSGDVAPGPTADVYAFTRENVQRNLYRVPVP